MSLPFDPACLPLLLGGLPHRNVAQALEVSRRYAGALLAWPQLPQRSFREHSYVQSAIGFPGLVIDAMRGQVYVDHAAAEQELDRLALAYLEDDLDYAALAADDASGLYELLRQGERPRGTLALKGQLLGPISLAAHLTDERHRPLIYDDVLLEALVHHLRLRAEWQEARLGEVSDTTIICLDEPFLETVGSPFLPLDWPTARDRIDEVLEGITGCRAIYAGGTVEWTEVLRTSADLIIADVYDHSRALIAAAAELPAFLERGGIVGLGLIPTDAETLKHTTAESLVAHAEAVICALGEAGVAPDQFVRRAVVSTSDTLSRLEIGAAERALQLVSEVSALLRQTYALG